MLNYMYIDKAITAWTEAEMIVRRASRLWYLSGNLVIRFLLSTITREVSKSMTYVKIPT